MLLRWCLHQLHMLLLHCLRLCCCCTLYSSATPACTWCTQLHKTVETREGEMEGLSLDLKVSKAELNRLQPMETQILDLADRLSQAQAGRDR